MSRRSFFKMGGGMLGAFLSGAATAKDVIPSDTSQKPQDCKGHTLVLQTDNSNKKDEKGFCIRQYTYTNQCSISVGKDNRLWIYYNNDWHRLSVDS